MSRKSSNGGLWAFAAILAMGAGAYLYGTRNQSHQSQTAPVAQSSAPSAQSSPSGALGHPEWPMAAATSPEPAAPFGDPICDLDVRGHSLVKHYAGFALDYDDRILASRWTAYKLTSEVVRTNKDIKREAKFWGDPGLEDAGLRITAHADYTNPGGIHVWDRGHLVPANDARCWGQQSAHDCFCTSNIVPQDKVLNEQAWEALEMRVDGYAKLKGCIWVFTGGIYDQPLHPFAPRRAVPAPDRMYKVVVWREKDDSVGYAAWVMPNSPLEKSVDLDHYLTTLAEVEKAVHVRFLPGLR